MTDLRPYERVLAARATGRPTAKAFISAIFEDFIELKGDALFGDDGAVIGGIAFFESRPVTVIALEKGTTTAERVSRNFGSAHPEGYRKAQRLMRQAEKFRRPVFCVVDTAGAYCGIAAEERGQGKAIADSLLAMMGLTTPVISLITGEGGSGGALALAASNEVWMLENAVYSVISPEGAASILYKDPKMAEKACEDLKMTAADLMTLGVIDCVFQERGGFQALCADISKALSHALDIYGNMPPEGVKEARHRKFRSAGSGFV